MCLAAGSEQHEAFAAQQGQSGQGPQTRDGSTAEIKGQQLIEAEHETEERQIAATSIGSRKRSNTAPKKDSKKDHEEDRKDSITPTQASHGRKSSLVT